MNCSIVWITLSSHHTHRLNGLHPSVCHRHLRMVPHGNPTLFWRRRWVLLESHLRHMSEDPYVLMTDTDVQVNHYSRETIHDRIRSLHRPRTVVLSTEQICWVGHACTWDEIHRFKRKNVSRARFMNSQFAGRRSDVLHMLSWGLRTEHTDDMRMIYEYVLAHPERVVLDEGQLLFGSLALVDADAHGEWTCWDGPCTVRTRRLVCTRERGVVCVDGVCPIVWHGNGPSTKVLDRNRDCSTALDFKNSLGTRFAPLWRATDVDRLHQLIRHFVRTCAYLSIDYLMDGGTLVGSMMHHGRIPWDDDFDVYVRKEDAPRLLQALSRPPYVARSIGTYAKLWSTNPPRVDNHRDWNWPFVDIGWLLSNETHAWEERSLDPRYARNVYPKEWLFPSVPRPFDGFTLSAPRDAEAFLRHRFGSAWRERCVRNHWDHALERWIWEPVETVARCSLVAAPFVRRTCDAGTCVEVIEDEFGNAMP